MDICSQCSEILTKDEISKSLKLLDIQICLECKEELYKDIITPILFENAHSGAFSRNAGTACIVSVKSNSSIIPFKKREQNFDRFF